MSNVSKTLVPQFSDQVGPMATTIDSHHPHCYCGLVAASQTESYRISSVREPSAFGRLVGCHRVYCFEKLARLGCQAEASQH